MSVSVRLFGLPSSLAVMQPRGQNGIGPVTVVVSPLVSLMEDQVDGTGHKRAVRLG